MSDKKHIDRLFQEKFKDFEVKPSAKVWENIQSQIEQPAAKPKVIPLWLRLAGVAALIALLFGIGSTFIGNNTRVDGNTNTVVETNANDTSNNNDNTIVSDNNSSEKTATDDKNINKNNLVNTDAPRKVIDDKISNETLNSNATASQENNNSNSASDNSNTDKNYSETNKKTSTNPNYNKAQYASSNSQQENKKKEVISNVTNQRVSVDNKSQNTNAETLYAQSTTKKIDDNTNVNVANSETKDTSNNVNVTGVTNKTNNLINKIEANPSNEGIAQTNNEEEKTNMNPKDEDAQTPNPLEEASLANTEDSIEKGKEETVMNRWTVNANVAPVYYNTLGKGSHIHDQFIGNQKNGEINTSYGINVGYALNNKLKVRSGINKLNLSYDTADVIIYENVSNTPSSAPLRNISFVPTNNGENISVLSATNLSIQQVGGVLNDNLNAALSQRISYVEVPVELEYALVNKRFGLHLIGGVSTFILDGNEVVTEVENRKTKIGEANNINNVSFTTNLGLGIDYKFNDNLKFNIEPTFKYQINAYSETSGDFNPYIIGVYTGFSYKF